MSELTARKWAGGSKGYWRVAGSQVLQVALPNSYWNRLGLKTLTATWQRLIPVSIPPLPHHRTCGPACPVVW